MRRQTDPNTFGFLMTDVARLFRAEFDRRVGEAGIGLTPGEGRTLTHAARAGVVRQTVLAERMGIEAMTLSGFLDRLEARGLIERRPDPTDRRAKLVALTDEADGVLERVQTVAAGLREDVSQVVSTGDWAILNASLRTIRDRLGELRTERESDAA